MWGWQCYELTGNAQCDESGLEALKMNNAQKDYGWYLQSQTGILKRYDDKLLVAKTANHRGSIGTYKEQEVEPTEEQIQMLLMQL